jgi:ribonuclease VapC
MFVDASVIIAIMIGEPESEHLAAAMEAVREERPHTSVIAVWEAIVTIYRRKSVSMAEAEARVQEFLDLTNTQILPITVQELSPALQAFERYGQHHYPDTDRNKALNLADCFHYAVAKSQRASILTKDIGFALTDVATVGVGD